MYGNKKLAGMMKQKINMEMDTSALDQEIANYEKQLRQCYANKDSILADLDGLDMYDNLNEAEKREFLTQLISEVHVYEESKPNGQWLKAIEFKRNINRTYFLICS